MQRPSKSDTSVGATWCGEEDSAEADAERHPDLAHRLYLPTTVIGISCFSLSSAHLSGDARGSSMMCEFLETAPTRNP